MPSYILFHVMQEELWEHLKKKFSCYFFFFKPASVLVSTVSVGLAQKLDSFPSYYFLNPIYPHPTPFTSYPSPHRYLDI